MAFSNDEKQEIKDIVLETMTEQSDAVDYTEQVVEFAPGDEVPIVRNGDGTGEKSYGRAPVSMFGGGGSGGVNGIKVGGSGQVLTPTSGVVTLPAYESGAEKNPVKYLKEATISQDGNSLTIKDNNNETKTFTPIGGGGGSVTPSDADPLEDGTKSAGSSASYSRGDHRHPHDTTKADKSEMAITPGTGENSDKTTIQLKDGLSTTVLTQHKAPTSQEVKNALGTGSGTTKYLREDGEWATPPSGGSGNTADVNYDTTNKKITKTIDGVTSDVVTVSTLKNDMNLGNVGNFKAVSTVASQGLTDTEKSNARTNIGAGTSNFSGNYNDLTNKPTIPTVPTNVSAFVNDAGYLTQHQDISGKADKIDTYTKTEVNNLISNTPESDVIVVEVPSGEDIATYLTDNIPAEQKPNNVFRVPGDTSYSEWGWNGTTFIMLDEKEYGIDDEPDENSSNLISSKGVGKYISKSNVSLDDIKFALTDKNGNVIEYINSKDELIMMINMFVNNINGIPAAKIVEDNVFDAVLRDNAGNVIFGIGKDGKIVSGAFDLSVFENTLYSRNKEMEKILLNDANYSAESNTHSRLQLLIITDTHEHFSSFSDVTEGAKDFICVDAVLHLGDFGYWVTPEYDRYANNIKAIRNTTVPLFMVPGNHDVGTRTPIVGVGAKDDSTVYERYIKPSVDMGFLKTGEYQENKCYYYHDFDKYKVRLIALYPYDTGDVFDTTYWSPVAYNSQYSNIAVRAYTTSDAPVNIPSYTKYSFKCVRDVTVTGLWTGSATYNEHSKYLPRYKALKFIPWYRKDQIDWFCDTLAEAGRKGYISVVVQHHSFISKNYRMDTSTRFNNLITDGAGGGESIRYSSDDVNIISQIVNAYQNGGTIQKVITPIQSTSENIEYAGPDDVSGLDPVTIDYTFSEHGKVVFLHGHTHSDNIIRSTVYDQTEIGFLCGTTFDAANTEISRRKVEHSSVHDTVTAFTIYNDKIHLSRIGANIGTRIDENTHSLVSKKNEVITF